MSLSVDDLTYTQVAKTIDHSLLRPLIGHQQIVKAVAFSPDGQLLASGSEGPSPHDRLGEDTVRIWQVATGASMQILRHGRGVRGIAFSPDGQLLATAQPDGDVELWRVADGTQLRTVQSTGSRAVAISPDGQLLATTATAGRAITAFSSRESSRVSRPARAACG